MLWTAPELLRSKYASKRGTQEGDVYSFAIILYEIHGRNGPFGDLEMSPKGNGNSFNRIKFVNIKSVCLG